MNKTIRVIRSGGRKLAAGALSALLSFPVGAVPAALAAEAPASVDGLEVGDDQVKVRLTGEAKYDAFATANPPRLVLQIFGAEYQAGAKSFSGKGKYLKAVRAGQFQRAPNLVTRIVLDLSEMTAYKVSANGGWIVVALGPGGPPEAPAEAAPAPEPAPEAMEAPKAAPMPSQAAKVGEAGGMTTQASAELAAMAQASDVTKEAAAPREMAAAEAPMASSRLKMPRGDIMSRLPRDLVSLDFDNTDIRDVIKLLAAKARINIIYGADVTGTLSLHLVEVPFHEAFRTTLTMMNLSTAQVGENILRILTPAALIKSQTAAATATRVIPLNYAKASEIMAAVNSVRSAEGRTGTTIADVKTNSLIVTESLEGMSSTERLIAQLDVRPKQVMIEAKLIEVSMDNSLHYGIQWDYLSIDQAKWGKQQGTNLIGTVANPLGGALLKPFDNNATVAPGIGAAGRGTGVQLPASAAFGALTFGRITNNYFLSATLTAAAAAGKLKVLSDPKVATLNNQPATINVTNSIPYVTSNVASTGVTTQQVSYVVTGIKLTVTPSINADGRITLDINPDVSQPSATGASPTTGAPAVNSRNAKTTVLVKDGETVVIGGLISDRVSNDVAKIPILGDIPILGWLFKKKSITRSRVELLIFVTPKIMAD